MSLNFVALLVVEFALAKTPPEIEAGNGRDQVTPSVTS